jgi:TonB family protein
MTETEKKTLYESVIHQIAKEVKKQILEYSAKEESGLVEEGWKENLIAGALALATFFISPTDAKAKGNTNPAGKAKTEFAVVDRNPSFPGGSEALTKFLKDNIKYPVDAEEDGAEGRVVLSFVVNKDGSISNIQVVKSVHPSLDKEAIRLLKMMPRWVPGKKNGRAVAERYTAPFVFNLE